MIVRRENSREIESGTYDLQTEMVITADLVLLSEQHIWQEPIFILHTPA